METPLCQHRVDRLWAVLARLLGIVAAYCRCRTGQESQLVPLKAFPRLATPARVCPVVPFQEPTGAAQDTPYSLLSGLAGSIRVMPHLRDGIMS